MTALPSPATRKSRRSLAVLAVVALFGVCLLHWQTSRGLLVLAALMASTPSNVPRAGSLSAVVWDIDGTLVDSTRLALDGTNEVLKANSLPEISQAQYMEGCRFTTPRRFAFHATGDPDDPIGVGLGKQFDDLYVHQVKPETVPLIEGMQELLPELLERGYRFSAVSNACTSYVRAVIAAHGLSATFEEQLGTDSVPAGKPAPDGLRQCCEAMGLEPSSCMYVGDAPTDGQAAGAAGMKGVGVTWGSHSRESLEAAFEKVVDTAADLRAAILEADS